MTESTTTNSLLLPSEALSKATASAALMAGDQELLDTSKQRYGFHIGDLGLLVGERTVAEVTPVPEVVRIPGTPPWFLGVSNLRGSLVPIFDLPRLFGFSDDSRGVVKYGLVMDQTDSAVGIPLENYPLALDDLKAVDELPPIPESMQVFVERTYINNQSLWIDFNYTRFFKSLADSIAA